MQGWDLASWYFMEPPRKKGTHHDSKAWSPWGLGADAPILGRFRLQPQVYRSVKVGEG